MSCEELRDNYELYALGLADEGERAEIRAHLDRQCQTCTLGVREARRLAAWLSGTAEPATPSSALRKRVLSSVGSQRPGFRWVLAWAVLASVMFFAAIYTGLRERAAEQELVRLRAEATLQATRLARLNEAFAILNGPETIEASFGPAQPRGKVFVHPARGVLLLASNLPPAPSGKAYEMWVIPKGGKPIPAGLFQSETNGAAMHIERGPIDVNATGAVAVTIENEAGAAQPTSQPIIVAALVRPAGAR